MMDTKVRVSNSSMRKIATGFGVIAVSTVGAIPVPDTLDCVSSTRDGETIEGISGFPQTSSVLSTDRNDELKFSVDEEWDEKKHLPEFKRLVVKKAQAVSGGVFTAEDADRLNVLQQMRRKTLPLSVSYEEFIENRERMKMLTKMADMLTEYRKRFEES